MLRSSSTTPSKRTKRWRIPGLRSSPGCWQGHRFEVDIRPERRSTESNAAFHALLTEISLQLPWAGQKRDAETWKRLITAAWLRARGESVEVLPAIDGHGIDVVFRRTSRLSKDEFSELLEFAHSWAAEQGVTTNDPHALEPA